MKKNKIIGIAVASLGIIFSCGAAFALYQQNAESTGFGIGAGTYTGSTSTVTYKINDATSPTVAPEGYYKGDGTNGGTGLSATYTQVKYEFALGATFANDLRSQTYVMGKVSVSVSGLNASFNDKVTVYAVMDGYSENTIGKSSFGNAIIDNVTLTSSVTEASGSNTISVKSDGSVHKLVVWVKFDMTGVDTLTQNELGSLYNISVSWTQVDADYDACAYIVGTGNSWTVDDEYMMAIDPTEEHWMYRYDGLEGSAAWTQAKAVKTATRVGDISKWSASNSTDSGNFELANGTTYSLYWDESVSGQLFTL